MKVRREILSVGYSVLGAGIGLGGASNMMDELPAGLIPTSFALVGIGLVIIVTGRLLPRKIQVNLPAKNPDRKSESN